MKRRRFLGTLAATVAAPLAMLPKRDMGVKWKELPGMPVYTSEPLPGPKPVFVTGHKIISVMDDTCDRLVWEVRERYSNGYSRTIRIKANTLKLHFWWNRLGRSVDPTDLPYKHLLATWDCDSSRIGPGPRTFH